VIWSCFVAEVESHYSLVLSRVLGRESSDSRMGLHLWCVEMYLVVLRSANFVFCRFNEMIFDSPNGRLSRTGINSQICLVVCMLAVACCFSPARGLAVRFSGSLPSLVKKRLNTMLPKPVHKCRNPPERRPSTLQSLQSSSHRRHHLLRVQVFLDRRLRRLIHRNGRRLYLVLQNLAKNLVDL
jgi:hypothetical protein